MLVCTLCDESQDATSPRRVSHTLRPSDTPASASPTGAGPMAQEQESPSAAYLINTTRITALAVAELR